MSTAAPHHASVDLLWIPVGAGGHCVRVNGRVFEALAARREHRAARDLYHAALELVVDGRRYTLEMTPAWAGPEAADHGVVCEGPVGLRVLGRSQLFRYEIRCWRDGVIPDVGEAVGRPYRVSDDADRARRVLELAPLTPPVTWGRDELRTGEMWNCNSVVAWLLARAGHDMRAIAPPPRGRAPGWSAGLVVAERQTRPARPAAARPSGR